MKDKTKLLYLLSIMVIMVAFAAVEENENAKLYDFFLFSDQKLTIQTWFYFLLEHMCKVMIGWFMWHEIERFNNVFRWWFMISIFNAGQYILHYNSLYYTWHGLNFSSHIISTFILGYAIYKE